MKALVVGGTGPTGPAVVKELLARSAEVTVLHRGLHEPDDDALRAVEHVHADPHFAESLADALGHRTFDTVIATYGRIQLVARVMEGRCGHFVAVGGNPMHPGMLDRRLPRPSGMRVLASESDATVLDLWPEPEPGESPRLTFARKVARAERAVLDAHRRGAYLGTYVRYPLVYGWRTWLQFERGVIRRLLDGRRRLVLPDGGLGIFTRCADVNAARAVALAVDRPEVAAGRVYHCGDDDQYSLHQWTELICAALGVTAEIVGAPMALARSSWDLLPSGPFGTPHSLVRLEAARHDLGYADVVPAAEALRLLVTRLAADPSMDEVTYDRTTEDALLRASDEMAAGLARTLGWEDWDDDGYFRSWHPYDHPGAPGEPGRYEGMAPPAQSAP